MDGDTPIASLLAAIKRSWYLVALAVVVGSGLALVQSNRQAELYRSSAEVLVTRAQGVEVVDLGASPGGIAVLRNLENERVFAAGEQVAGSVASELGYAPAVSITASESADVLVFSATDANGEAAALAANVYARTFIEERRARVVEEYRATAETVASRVESIEMALASLAADDPDRLPLEGQRDLFVLALQELSLGAELSGGTTASVTTSALVPRSPFQPKTQRNLAVGATLGALIGGSLALLRGFLDDRVRTGDDIEAVDPRLVSLAAIPVVKGAEEYEVVAVEDPDGAAAEGYRALRSAVASVAEDPDVRVIQVTSPTSGEGKTTTVANLGVTYARTGKRVVVVDGDLRRPRLQAYFATPVAPGLADVVAGHDQASQVVHRPLQGSSMVFMPAGSVAPNPGELLGSDDAAAFFAHLRQSADIVLVDSPPVLSVSDALTVAQLADATIVVSHAKKTKRKELAATLEVLDRVDARVVGSVLNHATGTGDGVYSEGYISGADDDGGLNAERPRLGLNGQAIPHIEATIDLREPSVQARNAPLN